MTGWMVVVPFKGVADAKSRLSASFDSARRAELALAFLVDTVSAACAVPAVSSVFVVSNEPELAAHLAAAGWAAGRADVETRVIADPGGGINAAVASGIALARASAADAWAAALTGDLAALHPSDLAQAFALAEAAGSTGAPSTFVPDREGSGTTMVAFAQGVVSPTHFGIGSAAAHTTAGFRPLAIPAESSLRLDIDEADDLERARLLGLGAATLAALDRRVRPRSSDPATRPASAPG